MMTNALARHLRRQPPEDAQILETLDWIADTLNRIRGDAPPTEPEPTEQEPDDNASDDTDGDNLAA